MNKKEVSIYNSYAKQSLLTFEFLCFKHNSYTRYTVDTLTYINNNLFSTKQFNKFLYTCIVKFRFL